MAIPGCVDKKTSGYRKANREPIRISHAKQTEKADYESRLGDRGSWEILLIELDADYQVHIVW